MELINKMLNTSSNISNVDKYALDSLRDLNITNLFKWYNHLLTNSIELNNKSGQIQIYNVFPESSKLPKNAYKISFSKCMNNNFPSAESDCYLTGNEIFDASFFHCKSELLHESEIIGNANLVFLVILKKLINYKLIGGLNYYSCNFEIIRSALDSTINEFRHTQLLDLIKDYDITDNNIIAVEMRLFHTIKFITQESNYCDKCKKVLKNIEINDLYSTNKMLTLSKCCNSYQIKDVNFSDLEIEVLI